MVGIWVWTGNLSSHKLGLSLFVPLICLSRDNMAKLASISISNKHSNTGE